LVRSLHCYTVLEFSNKIEEVNDINYKYYFAKATEIIEKIDNKQLKLFLYIIKKL